MRTLLAAAMMLLAAPMSIAAQMTIAHATGVSGDRYHAATHRLTKTQRAWFARAIADILPGKPLSSDEVLHSSVKDAQAPRTKDTIHLHASQ